MVLANTMYVAETSASAFQLSIEVVFSHGIEFEVVLFEVV
jgi:hypothetical protein